MVPPGQRAQVLLQELRSPGMAETRGSSLAATTMSWFGFGFGFGSGSGQGEGWGEGESEGEGQG